MRLWWRVSHATDHIVAAARNFLVSKLVAVFLAHLESVQCHSHPTYQTTWHFQKPIMPLWAALLKFWADLEFEIDQFIWHLLQTPQALAACVTSQIISIYPRMQALRSLAGLYIIDEKLIKELNSFSGEVSKLAEKRNRIIHDKRFVQIETNNVMRFQITAKKTLDFQPKEEQITDLNNFITTVKNTKLQFVNIRGRIENHILSSQDKQRSPLPYIARLTDLPPNQGGSR
jgi:hypothetical protein